MKKLITIALLILGLSVNAQKFETLFSVDTLGPGVIQLVPKKYSLFVNGKDTISVTPILIKYDEDFNELGIILHGFWVTGTIRDSISLYFKGKEIRLGECNYSKTENYGDYNIYTASIYSNLFTGLSDSLVIGNKVYIGVTGTKGILSSELGGFNKVTYEWYE